LSSKVIIFVSRAEKREGIFDNHLNCIIPNIPEIFETGNFRAPIYYFFYL